ncbi:MAG TPA: AAA family ATPase, partial [Pseudonocardia sp.]
MVDDGPGKPARKYCSAGHRAAGRRLRGGDDGWDLDGSGHPDLEGAADQPPALTAARDKPPVAVPPSRPAPGPPPHPIPAPPARPVVQAAPHVPEVPRRPVASMGVDLTGSAADLTDDLIVRQRVSRPTSGWRRAVFTATGGRVNPGLSEADEARQVLLRRVRRHLPGAHQIAVSSLKGGVGKTTVSAVLGLTLAEYRGDRVVAVDANPDAGTLADRL